MPRTTRTPSATRAPRAAPDHARYVCVHGHFYQPPRENPWLETVEVQESAAPHHDWNERITSECYAPNGASRIQNKKNQIVRIVNNYSRMSFNFGATLLSWLEEFAPRTYRMIQDADAASAERYSGHGSALAQVYNHIIMPLANERDARTQIRWGIADFEHRFGRKPEGMWLAETAASRAVLDLMAQEGIRYTVLAPNQCARVRRLASAGEDTPAWAETRNDSVDTTRPYVVRLDEGRSLAVFFYNGPNSRAIAFEGLLNSGEMFADRLLSGFDPNKPATEPQLAHVATDGESYGHHHKHGEMALSYAMHYIESNQLATLTNYGEYLEKFPPTWEAEIVEESSWSCSHGVERWRSDCGCNGGKPGWNQKWRGPLRDALNLVRDRTAPLAELLAKDLFKDVWVARDAYISVVLDRSKDNVDAFLAEHATHTLSREERVRALELMELERHTQLMYTSCGWFFDEISGIETVQIIAYAGRVLQLAATLFGEPGKAIEADFLTLLERAKSNVLDEANGADIYRKHVLGKRIDLEQVGAHYAISSMFRSYPDSGQLFCYDVQRNAYDLLASGRGRFAMGCASLRSRVTGESEDICFAVLHLGDQNLSAAVRHFSKEDAAAWADFSEKARQAIRRANVPDLIRDIDRFFGGTTYSLTSLFADEQERIIQSILNTTLAEVEGSLMRIYEEHATLLHFLAESNVPAPPSLALTAGFAINASLRRAMEAEIYDSAEISRLLRRAELDNVALDKPGLSYAADRRMKRMMVALEAAEPTATISVLNETLALAESLRGMPFEINLWQAQNIWNDMLRRPSSEGWSREWRDGFRKIGLAMNISVNELVTEQSVPAF